MGLFYKTQEPKHRQQKTKTPKNKKNIPKNTLLHSGKPPPIFVKFLFFIKVHSFRSTKLCFAENTIKKVFSAKHSFQASQIVKPLFEGKPKMALLQPKVPFWVFPCVRWNPYFCSVWWLLMGTKKSDIFQKQIVATKMRTSFTFWTLSVFAYFSKKWQFYKKKHFSSQPPKNTIFLGFFWNFLFPFFFSCFLFFFFQHKKDKNKKCTFFFENPFLTPWQTAKKYFRTPTHYLCFLRYPKNTIKLGKNKQTKSWTTFWRNLGPHFDSKNPKSWTTFWLYSIYIYMLWSYYLGQVWPF